MLNGDGAGGPLSLTFQIGARNTTNDQLLVNLNPQDTATLFAGAIPDVCAFLFKHPPEQVDDPEAHDMLLAFAEDARP